MNRSDAADRLERLLRRDLEAAARESGAPSEEDIDAYVAGTMSRVDRELFEQRLADDPALRSEVEALLDVHRALADQPASAAASAPEVVPFPSSATSPRPADAGTVAAIVEGGCVVPNGNATARSTKNKSRQPGKPSQSEEPSKSRSAPTALPTRTPQSQPTRWAVVVRAAAMGALAASLVILMLWAITNRPTPTPPEQAAGGNAGAGGNAAGGGAAAGGTAGGSGGATAGGRDAGAAGANAGASGGAATPTPTATITLRDGGAEVALLANGELRGLDALDAADRSAVARTLASGRLDLSTQVDSIAAPGGVLLSPGDTSRGFRVTAPLATAVRSARPTFSWTRHPEATGYRVRIEDADGRDAVIESPLVTGTSWMANVTLPAGRALTWQVEAQTPRGIVRAPVPPSPEARIVILHAGDRQALDRALNTARGSDLAAAVVLARFGVLDEADAALARLAKANPQADVINRVQRQLAARRFPR